MSLFLLLLLFLTVQGLLLMMGSMMAAGGDDDGGGGGAATSNGGERDAQVAAVSPFYANAQVSPFFFMSVAAKLVGEEDGKRLRKNDGGVGSAGGGGGGGGDVGVASAVNVVSKLREEKWWLVRKVGCGAPFFFLFLYVIFSLVPLFLCWFRFFFYYSFTLLPPSKSFGSFLYFLPKFPPYLHPPPPSKIIGAGREGHLTTAMVQGKAATLPMSWNRVGWLVMACINDGKVWGVTCVFGQVRRARQIGRIAGKDLKSTSSLPLHRQGRRRKVTFKTALFWFFFLRRENVIGKNLKMDYDK